MIEQLKKELCLADEMALKIIDYTSHGGANAQLIADRLKYAFILFYNKGRKSERVETLANFKDEVKRIRENAESLKKYSVGEERKYTQTQFEARCRELASSYLQGLGFSEELQGKIDAIEIAEFITTIGDIHA